MPPPSHLVCVTVLIDSSPLWVAQTNCYVLSRGSGEPAVIIDAPPDPEGIGALLATHDLVPAGLLLTHGHVDHAAGAESVERQHSVATWVHPDDDFLTLHPIDQLMSIFGTRVPGTYGAPVARIDLFDGQVLEIAGFRIAVRHTPGHTPGHVCFEVCDEGVLFSGDQLFAGSVGRTDLPGGSYEALMRSMRNRVLDLDDAVDVFPGHGPATTIGRERQSNPFLVGL